MNTPVNRPNVRGYHMNNLLRRVVPRNMAEDPPFQTCETVHLAFVVDNISSTVTLMKSILSSRYSSLYFHIILDSFNQVVLKKLMDTWLLPSVNYSFYSIDDFRDSISWIPNLHSSQLTELLKIQIPLILPSTVDRVIVLDTDVIVLSNIQELWAFFWNLRIENNLFALVDNTPNHIRGVHQLYDTSVLLFNLNAMRQAQWFHLWHIVVNDGLKMPVVSFSSDYIISSIITHFPGVHFILPCVWNVHYKNRHACGFNFSYYHIIQLNSLSSEEYYNLTSFYEQYDGKALRRTDLCDTVIKKPVMKSKRREAPLKQKTRREMCQILKRESEQIFRTHLFYYGRKYKPTDEYETTLVTQLSLDRLDKFHLLINHWDGPISITMYGTDTQAWNLTQFISENGINRMNMAIHIVYKQGKFYPVNHLRNIALNAVSTPYVFLNDGDFLPSFGLFSYLKKANKVLMTGSEKRALVIPAFNGEEGFTYPKDKADLQEMLQEGSVRMFCVWCAHQTHGPTNYSVWEKTSFPYRVEWAFHYEPYVVVRSDIVRYDERFVGYGWNKVSQLTEMKAQGYEFVVLPDDFIIHSPHRHSADREIWKRKNFKFCINTIWKKFIQELLQKYSVDCLKEYKNPPAIINIKI